MNIFGIRPTEKKVDSNEEAKLWKRNLNKEIRRLDKDLNDLTRSEKTALAECKKLSKMNQIPSAKIMAKEVVQIRRAKERLLMAKAQLNSVSMALQNALALKKIQGIMSKSTDIMSSMSKLMNVPELKTTIAEMSREMERAGLIEEMIGDTFSMTESDEFEAEVDKEINNVIAEITSEMLAPAGKTPSNKLRNIKNGEIKEVIIDENQEKSDVDADLARLQARLGAL